MRDKLGRFKKGMISWAKGKKFSEEHKRKLRLSRKRIPARNIGKHWKLSDKTKRRMSLSRIGPKNPHWKGGSRSYYQYIANAIYREHCINIICEICSSPNDVCIHHKNGNWRDNKLNNLQAFCKACHTKLHRKGVKSGNYNSVI